MKGNDRAKTQWFLLYILKSWSEIIDRQKRWELRSLYLTENIWKTYIYIYIYTNIHTANEDVNMTAILALINITWAVVKIRPEKKNFRPAQFTKLFARGVWRTAWTAREEMSLYEDSKVLSLSLNSYQQK